MPLWAALRHRLVKFAVTDRASDMVATQVPVPLQPLPDQLVNVDPVAAVAVSVTTVSRSKSTLQVVPQLSCAA